MAQQLPNYFTFTLGEEHTINASYRHNWETVNDFLDEKARVTPDDPAVGFPVPKSNSNEQWSSEVFSFKDLRDGSIAVAASLKDRVSQQFDLREVKKHDSEQPPCIALICPSSIDFIFVWLGVIRAGWSVLLIAPQCQQNTIAHLCKICHASILLYHRSYDELAISAVQCSEVCLKGMVLPYQLSKDKIRSLIQDTELDRNSAVPKWLTSKSTAYIHHTSGTSGSFPKPIPQSHWAAIGILPCLPRTRKATFTTTPLYHGGIADCFRSWSSGELIWLFPGAQVPITERNIISSLSAANHGIDVPIRYFSSVPYVLQMLEQNDIAVEWLKKMDIVGVGGAALPQQIGDSLVRQGVHLASRFGSAECGFLLSSHRNYDTDFEWQYLRPPVISPYLKFETHAEDSGLAELIVLEGWPHIAQKDADGRFATGDLFESHKTLKRAWKYNGRKDSQITLNTGKKFDPAPIEEYIVAFSPEITDALIFGNGKQIPGILVFINSEDVGEIVLEAIDMANRKANPPHSFIDSSLVIIYGQGEKLVKSSKGTVMRKASEIQYSAAIEQAYLLYEKGSCPTSLGTDEEKSAKEKVRAVIKAVVGRSLKDHENFYDSQVNSIACLQIKNLLQQSFRIAHKQLPWSLIYDCGNIENLTVSIENMTQENLSMKEENSSPTEEMLRIVARFSSINSSAKGAIVVLTGCTGSLGANILKLLLENREVLQVYCLVRAKTNQQAQDRVLKSLQNRRIEYQEDIYPRRLLCLASELDKVNLGLDMNTYFQLRAYATLVIHAAWPVNFSLPLSAFESSFEGLNNLLTLTSTSPLKIPPTFLFCSSTAAVLENPSRPIPENISKSPLDASLLGYSQSKWVAESICEKFQHKSNSIIKIARIGQLTGDSQQGIWNMREAYPLILSTMRELGCLPCLQDQLNWLPLDKAARAIIEIAFSGASVTENKWRLHKEFPVEVYHVVNKHMKPIFADLLQWLKEMVKDEKFELVEPKVWMDRLEALKTDHPAKFLLRFWRKAYGDDCRVEQNVQSYNCTQFETEEAEKISETMRGIQPVDKELIGKIWSWLNDNETA